MDDLTMLGIKYNCDKSYFHNYTPFYEKFFKTLKYNDINILEIGVNYGASLLMMKDYFPNAHIYAIDIDPNTIKHYDERYIHINVVKTIAIELINCLKILNSI
jgi:predicted O-methyltransferase YrrM